MALELITQLFGDFFLQFLDFRVAEFDHLTAVEIDQMVMMIAVCILIARTPIAELKPFKNA